MNYRISNLALCALVTAIAGQALAQFDPIIGPQKRIDVAGGTWAANETSAAAVHPGNEIVGTWNDWRRSPNISNEVINMGVAVSNDKGVTWTDFLVRPPVANQSGVEGDPMTAYDHRTGTLWVGAISFASNGGVYVARKNSGLNTFQNSVMARVTSSADKCWMAAGRNHQNANSTNVYIAYNQGSIRSTDMGQTWSAPVNLGSGIGFLPVVGPNGEVYVSYWDFGTGHWLRRSVDSGATFQGPFKIATRLDTWGTQDGSRFPGNFRCPPMNTLAVDKRDGALYAIYPDTTNIVNGQRNVDLYMAKSTNQGTTWSTPAKINFDNSPPGDQFFPWLEIDDNGRMHIHFFDSRNTVQNDNVVNGMFDNYYMYSDDRGATWKEARLTPNSWNCDNDGLARSQQFIGDYSGLAYGGNRVYPCYLSSQNGDTDTFTNVIVDPRVFASGLNVVFGSIVSGGLSEVRDNDANRLVLQNGTVFLITQSPITVEFTGTTPESSVSKLAYRTVSQVNLGNLTQRIDLFNFNSGLFEEMDSRPASVNADITVDVTINAGAGNYRGGAGELKSRLRIRDDVPAFLATWQGKVNQVMWGVTP